MKQEGRTNQGNFSHEKEVTGRKKKYKVLMKLSDSFLKWDEIYLKEPGRRGERGVRVETALGQD